MAHQIYFDVEAKHMKLLEYVKDPQHGAVNDSVVVGVRKLIKTFFDRYPPSFPVPIELSHRCYQEKQGQMTLAGAMLCVHERERYKSGLGTNQIVRYSPRPQNDEKKRVLREYLVRAALPFACFGVGNCSHRASFAAIHLAKLFENSNIRVALVSSPKYDQFAVYLTKNNKDYYVYDPLTNPEVVHEHADYAKNILSKFRIAPRKATKFGLWITAKDYGRLTKTLTDYHNADVNFGSATDIARDPGCRYEVTQIKDALKKLRECRRSAHEMINHSDQPAVQSNLFSVSAGGAGTEEEKHGGDAGPGVESQGFHA